MDPMLQGTVQAVLTAGVLAALSGIGRAMHNVSGELTAMKRSQACMERAQMVQMIQSAEERGYAIDEESRTLQELYRSYKSKDMDGIIDGYVQSYKALPLARRKGISDGREG